MANIYDMADTWNDGATTFTAIKMDVTDTASASGSLLMDLQVASASKFSVDSAGIVSAAGIAPISGTTMSIATNTAFTGASNLGFDFNIYTGATIQASARALMGNGFKVGSSFGYEFSSTTSAAGTSDLYLTRKTTRNLRLGQADAAVPLAQTLSVQSVTGVADTAGADFTIEGSQGTGTGAGGSILFKVAPAGGAGSGQNGLETALTISSTKAATFENYMISNAGGISFEANGLWQRSNGHLTLLNTAVLGWSGGTNVNVDQPGDTRLYRDATGTLALRNGANAQTFRVYNTYNGTNDEWGTFDFSTQADQLTIGSMKSGSGQSKSIRLVVGGTRVMISDGSFVQVDKDLYPTQNIIMASKYTEMAEMTAPAAPATNKVRIYAEDNGAGKTRLMALFPTGAAQQIAIEP